MDLINDVVLASNPTNEAPATTAASQLSEIELCLVGGGMGDVLQ